MSQEITNAKRVNPSLRFSGLKVVDFKIRFGGNSMKMLLVVTLTLILALPVIAMAQDPASSQSSPSGSQAGAPPSSPAGQSDQMGQSGKSGNVKGTVSQDGKTLVGDDGKSWTISNPDAVKGHEGHHVELKGSADASSNTINVSSVKMLKGDKDKMKKDSSQSPQ